MSGEDLLKVLEGKNALINIQYNNEGYSGPAVYLGREKEKYNIEQEPNLFTGIINVLYEDDSIHGLRIDSIYINGSNGTKVEINGGKVCIHYSIASSKILREGSQEYIEYKTLYDRMCAESAEPSK